MIKSIIPRLFTDVDKALPGKKIRYTSLNPYSYYLLHNIDYDFKNFTHISFDGVYPLVFLNIFGYKYPRLSFDNTRLGKTVLKYSDNQHLKMLVVGATRKESNAFVDKLKFKYQNIIIENVNGYEKDSVGEWGKYIEKLQHENTYDFILLSLGTPLQMKLIDRLSHLDVDFYTCGGYVRQGSGQFEYFPYLVDKLQIRFLYRMVKEKTYSRFPKALLGLLFVFKDLLKLKLKKNTSSIV